MSISDRLDKWIKDSEDVLEAVLEGDIDPEAFTDGRGGQALAALRAVLDLHKREWWSEGSFNEGVACEACSAPDGTYVDYPCPTVRAIEAALGEGA